MVCETSRKCILSILAKFFRKNATPNTPPPVEIRPRVRAYQIVYDDVTRAERDPGFEPLENVNCERPDWFEYWPIRTYLHTMPLDESTLYGFVSPRFHEKTKRTSADVNHFIQTSQDADVYSLSPFPCHCAAFLNVFEHTDFFFGGFVDHVADFFAQFDPNVDLHKLVNHSDNTIFSNFFFAKPKFWREWLRICDKLHKDTKDGQHFLNSKCNYFKSDGSIKVVEAKVFAMECVASYLLARSDQFSSISYPSRLMPVTSAYGKLRHDISQLDELKRQWLKTGEVKFLEQYRVEQKRVIPAAWPHWQFSGTYPS